MLNFSTWTSGMLFIHLGIHRRLTANSHLWCWGKSIMSISLIEISARAPTTIRPQRNLPNTECLIVPGQPGSLKHTVLPLKCSGGGGLCSHTILEPEILAFSRSSHLESLLLEWRDLITNISLEGKVLTAFKGNPLLWS